MIEKDITGSRDHLLALTKLVSQRLDILLTLYKKHPITQKNLSNIIGKHETNVSTNLTKLENAQLIYRIPSIEKKHSVANISLTNHGRRLMTILLEKEPPPQLPSLDEEDSQYAIDLLNSENPKERMLGSEEVLYICQQYAIPPNSKLYKEFADYLRTEKDQTILVNLLDAISTLANTPEGLTNIRASLLDSLWEIAEQKDSEDQRAAFRAIHLVFLGYEGTDYFGKLTDLYLKKIEEGSPMRVVFRDLIMDKYRTNILKIREKLHKRYGSASEDVQERISDELSQLKIVPRFSDM